MRRRSTIKKIHDKEEHVTKRIEEQKGLTLERRYICYM
jgi:hypothetical protein